MPKDSMDSLKPVPRNRVRRDLSGAKGGGGGGGGGKGGSSSPPVESANTLQTNAILRLIEVLGEGPIKGIRQVYLNETPLTDTSGNPNFKGVSVDYRLGLPSQPPVSGFASQAADTIVDTIVNNATPVIQTITDPDTDAACVTIKIPALFEYKDNGDMVGTGVSFSIQYRPSGGAWTDIAGSPFNLNNEKNTAPAYLPYRFPLTGNAPWDIRVVRNTADTTNNTKLQNAIYFFALSQILEQKFTYPNTAYMAIRASAQQFGDSIPTRAALVDGLICKVPTNFDPLTRTYSGIWNGTFKDAWTDCPAWCVNEMITNERFGLGDFISQQYLDPTLLYSISQYCAQPVDNGAGGTEPRFTFNAYIGTRQEAYDLINAMCSVFRGMVYWSMGTAMFAHDAPKDPILTVTRANTITGDFSYQGASILTVHNRINVSYNNPDKFYKRDVVTVNDPDHIRKYGLRPTDIIAFGCTSKAQAIRAGRWLMYTERMESDILTYVAGPDHVDAVPGSVVRVMDPSVMGVSMGGRLKAHTSTSVTLDRPVDIVAGATYELVVHDTNRVLHYRAITNAPGAATVINTTVALPTLTDNPLETVWALRRTDGPDTLYRILNMREVGSHQYEVTALRHSPDKYSIIENGYDIPSYPLPLLPTGPLPVPSDLQAREQVTSTSGTQDRSSIAVSIVRPSDPRVRGLELQYRRLGQQWQTVDLRMNANFVIDTASPGDRYQFQSRAYDALGGYSAYTLPLNLIIRGTPVTSGVPNVTSPSVSGGVRSIDVQWTNPAYAAFKEVEVFMATTNVEANAVKVGSTPAERFTISDLATGQTRFVWLRVVAHGTPLKRTTTVFAGQATTQAVATNDIADGAISLIKAGTSLVAAIDAAAGSAAGDVLAAQAARDAAIVAQNNSIAAQNAAQTANTNAQAAFTAADAAKTAALGAQSAAVTAQGLAQSAQTAAQAARDLTLTYRDAASASATTAATANTNAQSAMTAAQTAQTAAQTANTNAQAALASTLTSQSAAALSATNAATAQGLAASAQSAAETARNAAQAAQAAALASETNASNASGVAVSASAAAGVTYAVAGPTQLTAPASAWTNNSNTAFASLMKAPAPGAQFVTGDADFGDCYEFQGTTNLVLGPAYGFAYVTGRIYDVAYRFKAVAGPCRTTFGLTTQLGTTQVQTNVQTGTTDFNTVDGVVTRVIRFGPSGTSTAGADALVVLSGSAADRAYPFIRQNSAVTTGRLRVAQIAVRDVTDSISASNSASAAATQATAAGVSATAAGTSASAAQLANTNAQTALSGAQSAQTNAATSATNAANSAAAASSSATNAANSATTAGSSATAAGTSASNAATSASNAALSATSAQSSAVSARVTQMNGPILPFDFRDGLAQWTDSRTGDPAVLTNPSGYTVVTDAELGQCVETTWAASGLNLLTRGLVRLQAGRIYSVTTNFKVMSTTGNVSVQLGVAAVSLTSAYAQGSLSFTGAGTFAPSTTTVYQHTLTYSSSAQTGVNNVVADFATLPFMRAGFRSQVAGVSTVVRIGMIRVEDVTAMVLSANSATGAAGSASAAATSASAASASATSAGTFASNASTSASTAATSATNASNSATAAATSATNASTSASGAATSATTATNSANTATTQAGNAATSASQAATSATNASGSASSAASSATTAADTLTTAQRIASNLLPYDFTEDGRYWTSTLTGAPGTRTAPVAAWTFPLIGDGKVAQASAPSAVNVNLCPLAYVPVIPGNRYRTVVRARHVGAFAGGSNQALRLYLRGMTSAYAAGTDVGTPIQTFAAPDTWYDFTFEGVATADPFLTLIVQLRTANFNTAGPVIQIASARLMDVTSMVAAQDAATAAATSASTAAVSATNAGTSASAAQTAKTAAETAQAAAQSSQTAAALSATNAAGSASTAATSATNAANSATTAGNSATSATTQANNASTSATNAAQSATASQNSLVSARLTIASAPLMPYDFADLGQYWSTGFTGSPSAIARLTDSLVQTGDTDFGNTAELTWGVVGASLNHAGIVTPVAGRVYRVTSQFKVVSTAGGVSVPIGPHARTLSSTYAQVAANATGTITCAPGATIYTVSRTYSSAAGTGVDVVMASLGTAPFVRFGLRINAATVTVVRVGTLKVEDVTDSLSAQNNATLAAGSATAAASSASSASTSATAAGTQASNAANSASAAATSASNALGSANAASTSASNASTSASNAATSASSASGSANTASTQASNAATSASQAATSASNASGSATAAATSLTAITSAQAAIDATINAQFPSDFQNLGRHFTATESGFNPAALADAKFRTVAGIGNVYFNAGFSLIAPRGFLAAIPGRVYYVEARVRTTINSTLTGGTKETVLLGARLYNSDGTAQNNYFTPASYAGSIVTKVTMRVVDGWITLAGTMTIPASPAYAYLRPRLYMGFDGAGNGNAEWECSYYIASDVTSQISAQQSANAAATSESNAASSQTAAAASASAAAVSATNANTSAGNAATSATQASTSATNAAGSASAASTSASNAAGSATTAGTQATAAGTSASNAATSATNAASSATSAAASLVSARLSIINAPILPYDFSDGKVAWTQARNGAPNVVADAGGTIVTDTELGQALELSLTAGGASQNVLSKGTITPVPGRVYRVTVKFKFYGAPGAASVSFGFVCSTMDSAFALVADTESGNVSYAQNLTAVYTVSRTFSDTAMTGVDNVVASLGTAQNARFGFRRNSSSGVNASIVRFGLIQVQDVTQEILSSNSATTATTQAAAASGSASSAATSATAAGTSATAAAASATTASTQAGNASTSASQAATSASNASGSANSAATSASTAASTQQATDRVVSSILPSDFLEDGRFWTGQGGGAPGARGDVNAAWVFATDATEGRVITTEAPVASTLVLTTKGYIAAVTGRRYRITIRARHVGAFVGSSATAFNLRHRGITATFTVGGIYGSSAYTFAAANTWEEFVEELTYSGAEPYLSPQLIINDANLGTTGPVIQVSRFICADITSEAAAEGSASAAATSATAASASQTAAGNSASAANTSATNAATSAGAANTSAGNASTSASNASTSASNAAGSANTAATSATTASNASTAATVTVARGLPADFAADGQFFQSLSTGAPSAGNALTGSFAFATVASVGRVYQLTPLTSGDTTSCYTRGVISPAVGRGMRVTVRARIVGTVTTASLTLQMIRLDANYATPTVVATSNTATITTSFVNYVLNYTTVAADVFLRFGFIKQSATAGTGRIEIMNVIVEDVTSQNAAAGSATAAANSATTATTQATNASNSATAANTSATNAATSATGAAGSAASANTSAVNASSSATDAAGSSASALSYMNTTARMTGGGVSKNPLFTQWTAADPVGVTLLNGGTTTTAKITSGVRYVNAVQMVGNDTTQNRPSTRLHTTTHALDCVPSPERVLVRAEVELVSGNISGGACIAAYWQSTGGTNAQVNVLLNTFMVNTTGKVQTVEWYVERPATYVGGTSPLFIVEILAVSNLNGATRAACTLNVHRFDFEVITANSLTEIFQRSKVSVDGIASAAVGLRAQAGSGGALLELVALADPVNGTVSAARIAADNIILDGSVKAAKIDTTTFAASGLALFGGTLQSTNYVANTSGWKITNAGAAEFNSLLVRQSMIVNGAVSATAVRLFPTSTITISATTFATRQEIFASFTTGVNFLHEASGGGMRVITISLKLGKVTAGAGARMQMSLEYWMSGAWNILPLAIGVASMDVMIPTEFGTSREIRTIVNVEQFPQLTGATQQFRLAAYVNSAAPLNSAVAVDDGMIMMHQINK